MSIEPSSPVSGISPQRRLSRAQAAFVSWFFVWPALLFAGAYLIERSNFFYLCAYGVGTILWMFSCYVIYDKLFTMAEARWPAAKTIRNIARPFLRMLFSHHHSS